MFAGAVWWASSACTIYHHLSDRLEDLAFVRRGGSVVAELHAALPRHADGALTLHGDLGTWDVLVDGDRWSIIDWDSITRGQAETEVAYCLVSFCNLWRDRALPPREAVRRMRAFAAGYGMDDADLARTMAMIGDSCRALADFVHGLAREDVAGFVRLLAEGHDELWLSHGAYADAQLPSWLAALSPQPHRTERFRGGT